MNLGTRCERLELVSAYALHSLPVGEARDLEAHIAACPHCRGELEQLRPVIDSLDCWPTDMLRPSAALRTRLAERLATETGGPAAAFVPTQWREPDWTEAAPGISCQMLSRDDERHRVTMLVRLAPGVHYPPHTHAGVEELHLLDGELWIEERKLHPGDYSRALPGTSDRSVWSETGCTCLLTTSSKDILG